MEKKVLLLAFSLWCFGSAPPRAAASGLPEIKWGAVAAGSGQTSGLALFEPETLFWNPAGLSLQKTWALALSQQWLFLGIPASSAVGILPTPMGAFGFGCQYIDYGDFGAFDTLGNPTGTTHATDTGMTVGYGFPFAQWGHFGASLKTWYSLWDENSRFGCQVDLGLLYNFQGFGDSRIGVLAKNLAPSLGLQDRSYTLGLFWPTFLQSLRLVTETTWYESQNTWQINQGFECLIHTWMGLRCGYQTILQPGGFLPGWAGLGAGLRLQWVWQKWHAFFDYAFLPYDYLGNQHLLTLTLRPSSTPVSHASALKKRTSTTRPLTFQAGR